ncbi:MAG: electron transfer flavoprotein subunit beta/FixA family protein [Chloroflexia bacterium]|nr:electron transfer flavoprotein subunit beta/FixA family protein [Chloroflexia bacterium]
MSETPDRPRIAVLVKQVADVNAIETDPDSHRAIPGGPMVMNTYDAYSIGEAVTLKETHGAHVTVICAGPDSVREVLLRGLATGADAAIHIVLPDNNAVDTLVLAEMLGMVLEERAFDLILAGQAADDYETGQVPSQLAELLGIPHVSLVTHIEIESDGLCVWRDAEASKEIMRCPVPAVMMVLSGRDGPQHHPTLRGMMAAKRKPIERVEAPDPERARRLSWSEPVVPEKVFAGIIVQDEPADVAAAALVDWLEEHKLIARREP